MTTTLPEVDQFLEKAVQWKTEMTELRAIVLDCGLNEAFKWKTPCYTYNGKNIVMIAKFKDYCTLSFFKGSLLKDSERILHRAGENSNHVMLLKLTSVQEISELKATIKAYIFEAIEIEKLGLKVEKKDVSKDDYPEELLEKFRASPEFKVAFEALTPGRQRGYLLHFKQAKQAATRISRIEKYTERILNGKGFHDCVCGASKRMPTCDGSHKFL